MKPEISYLYYQWCADAYTFIFIEYEFFFKVIINYKSIILTKQQLLLNKNLFQIYIISLLLTENTNKIILFNNFGFKKPIYGIYIIYWIIKWNNDDFHLIFYKKYNMNIPLMKNKYKNPLNTLEPKRHNSIKKINKFFRFLNKICISKKLYNLSVIIPEYFKKETEKLCRFIEYEKNIEIFSSILHNYGYDIYKSIIKKMIL